MSLIIPANSAAASGGYQVANSLRFHSNTYLTATFGSAPTLATKNTISLWFKRSELDGAQQLYATNSNAANIIINSIGSSNSSTIAFYTNSGQLLSPKVYRDVSAWIHIVFAFDSTQGTAANRFKVYINGVEETSFNNTAYPAQNEASQLGVNGEAIKIGTRSNHDRIFEGYMAETAFVDGQALDATSFGEFDEDSGIWKPIDISGLTFGNNGFYLEYKQSGTGTNSSGMGADTSGNDLHFAVTNFTAIDQSTDTCTNNFATFNPLGSAAVTFSEGNLQITNSSTSWLTGIGSIGASSGKFYGECKVIAQPSGTNDIFIGFLNLDLSNLQNQTSHLGEQPYSAGIFSNGGSIYYNTGNQFYSGAGSYSTNAIIQLAMDLDNGFLYWGVNGTYVNSGNPTSGGTGTGGMAISNLTAGGSYTFGATVNASAVVSLNFGSPAYAISSGNADGNGYGNFEYAVPSGYLSLCTKNLSEVLG
jgi:hypothetical protein